MIWVLVIWLLLINAAGFLLMGTDKRKARKGEWRIPEKVFFIVSAVGGSLGSLCGMYVFHHKTQHWYFVVGIPVILAVQICLALVLGIVL